MARLLRIEYPGAIYHITCRMIGYASQDAGRLFTDDHDRGRFLERLGERVEEYQIRLYLFALMTSHVHLVFETPAANCSRFMQALSTAYTVYYNRRHGRHGHLLDGRYRAKLVEGDRYLLALSRYVHLNPVRIEALQDRPLSERTACLRSYRWSSYPAYIGLVKAPLYLTCGPVLSEMAATGKEARRRYRAFVESGLAETDASFREVLEASPRCIGGERFRNWIDDLYQTSIQAARRPEDAAFRRVIHPLQPLDVLRIVGREFGAVEDDFCRRRRRSPLRAVAARCLIRYAGLNRRDAADQLRMGSGSAVSNQLAHLPDLLVEDRALQARVARIEARLQAARRAAGKPAN